jgi:hypothetical protein
MLCIKHLTAAASALRSDTPSGVSERGRSVPFLT